MSNLIEMELKKIKKSWLYLITFSIGILLIIIGIIMLVNTKENDKYKIFTGIIILSCWTIFTVVNVFLYKKERKKEKAI